MGANEYDLFRNMPSVPDTDRPNSARMYDYYLGGSAHFAIDRKAADDALEVLPQSAVYARANRAFLGRVVRFLLSEGVDQFLDLGSGIPTVGNVHEIAHRIDPSTRVAYVDHEPVAVAHAQRMLTGQSNVTITQADVRDPQSVLTAPGVAGMLDFSRPIAVLAIAILPFVPDDEEVHRLVASYREASAPGSWIAISHISQVSATDEQARVAHEVMARTPTPVLWRDRDSVLSLFDGYVLADPGLVLSPLWRPDSQISFGEAGQANAYGGVGRLDA
ncbi:MULTISPECIES: SAM-dependent methyltransferase [unclassified Saccharopolyspora]|uniref:SAM-dependent methyltransferase n=1 Tax=unclassified Saccharopolyspora TaxID=2646250 RepID=UPI001CD3246D|nr:MULTISPECIES: SAM-dependent methyltransferase [unclassified Saccharopolyspora]MCA1185806.1 SAM-dependent methyltransferase [Saccharopolyspora sp. 6T]MCA1280922.1 SAM-dependent methyltransferase [Saccharopolyspora sp. 7B]